MATLYFAYWKTVGNQLAAVVMKVKLTSFCYSVLSFGSYALVLLFREQNKRYMSRLFFRVFLALNSGRLVDASVVSGIKV